MAGYPAYEKGMYCLGKEIKRRIRDEIGEWLTVSIGIGPNRFLAKQASNLRKPDGLEEINYKNYRRVYSGLKLSDLHGINKGWKLKLNMLGIYKVTDFYDARMEKLKTVFKSISAYHWFMRLRGWEVDDVEFGRKSFGSMYSLPKQFKNLEGLSPILCKMVEKVGRQMRQAGHKTRGLYLGVLYKDRSFWHKRITLKESLDDSRDIYKRIINLMKGSFKQEPVAKLMISYFNLTESKSVQLNLFEKNKNKDQLVLAMDKVNDKWREYMIAPAVMGETKKLIPDSIGFGKIGSLDGFI